MKKLAWYLKEDALDTGTEWAKGNLVNSKVKNIVAYVWRIEGGWWKWVIYSEPNIMGIESDRNAAIKVADEKLVEKENNNG